MWKHLLPFLDQPRQKLFQKDLIVWKQRERRDKTVLCFQVSEGLNSVETMMFATIFGVVPSFRRT